jgi:hypothetical protein
MARSFYFDAREVGETTILPLQFTKPAWIDHFKPLNVNVSLQSPAFGGVEAECRGIRDILMLLFLPLETVQP